MKKSIILVAAFLMMGIAAQAQNYMLVDTEKVFKSVKAYNDALSQLEKLGENYQKQIDEAFAQIEKMYSDYQGEKAYLSQAKRTQREDAIIASEKQINKYQQQVFGQDGDLMKKRVELIKPIQDGVFAVINKYAQANKYDLVLDIAANPSVLYYAPSADKTDAVITLAGQVK